MAEVPWFVGVDELLAAGSVACDGAGGDEGCPFGALGAVLGAVAALGAGAAQSFPCAAACVAAASGVAGERGAADAVDAEARPAELAHGVDVMCFGATGVGCVASARRLTCLGRSAFSLGV